MPQEATTRPVVVVGVEGMEHGSWALRYAVGEARRRKSILRVVHVAEEMVTVAPSVTQVAATTLHKVGLAVLKQAGQQAHRLGCDTSDIEVVLAEGPRDTALLEQAQGAVCLVLGRRNSRVQHLQTGSTTSALAAHGSCPVICVPPSWNPDVHRGLVGVGIDTTAGASRTLDRAFEAAAAHRAPLEILHAWRPLGQYEAAIWARTSVDEWSAETRDALSQWVRDKHPGDDVKWTVEPKYQAPELALYEASLRADLLVLGRHGHGHGHGFAVDSGSTTRALLRSALCPVMVVPTARHDA